MAVYKVPQDVEADDKLIGPFSFRQFIYLIIVAIAIAMAWGLSQLFIPLAIIPLPIVVFFAALALPLRKDQPMEAYLTAVVSFYFLKSRKRFWIPDGIDSFVTIIPPKDSDKILTKELDESEAQRRLDYLAQLVDSHGWAIRGAGAIPDTSVSTDLYYESQATPDMMDNTTDSAKAMAQHLSQEASQQKRAAINTMQSAAKNPGPSQAIKAPVQPPNDTSTPPIATVAAAPTVPDDNTTPASTLPSVDEIRAREEKIIQQEVDKQARDVLAYTNALIEEAQENAKKPAETQPPLNETKTAPTTSVSTPDTGTMELTQKQAEDLSKLPDKISTISQEANHIAQKNRELNNGDEITIPLR